MRGERGARRTSAWSNVDALSEEQLLFIPRRVDEDDDDHMRALVRRAVRERLSAKQREVVEAYFFLGLSQGEIARRLGIRQQVVNKRLFGKGTAENRVGGAIKKLHQVLAPELLRVTR